jgi:hypothetical protein
MDDEPETPTGLTVALVSAQPRLRRILRLALDAAGYAVLETPGLPTDPPAAGLHAAVVDIDSLGLSPREAIREMRGQGMSNSMPVLFISIYPHERDSLPRRQPTDHLQPPSQFVRRKRRLAQLLAAAPGAQPASNGCTAADGQGRSLA